MRVLLLTEEAWNDNLYPNNVLTNWLTDFPGTLANLYLASGKPENGCCMNYFQITDGMAVKSLVRSKSGGKWFFSKSYGKLPAENIPAESIPEKSITAENNPAEYNPMENNRWKKSYKAKEHKVLKGVFGGTARLSRDFLWLNSKLEEGPLMEFLTDFRPEVIFSLRFYSRRMLYMERLLHSATGAPVIAFTGDDEYSLRQMNASPLYWARKIMFRRELRETAPIYAKYLTLSQRQAKKMEEELGVAATVLRKGGDFEDYQAKSVSEPIKIVYAGRLYCNRTRTLEALAAAIKDINRSEVLITLDIYTRDTIDEKLQLLDDRSVFLKGYLSPEGLKKVYQAADIALLAESFDIKNKLLTKYSFSTKVVDCLASSCAILAIGPYENEGIRYLKQNKAAICVGNPKNIYPMLSHIAANPDKIEVYRRRAWELGKKEHQKNDIRKKLAEILETAIAQNKSRKDNAI